MADTTQEGTNGEAKEDQTLLSTPPIDITHQYIKDLSFENPQSPQFLVEADATPQISIQVNANAAPLGDRRFEVILYLNARAEHEGQAVFIAELQYGAHVVVGDVEDEIISHFYSLKHAFLFPFARQILSNVVREGGFPPLLMAPVDFLDMYAQGIAVAQDEDENNKNDDC